MSKISALGELAEAPASTDEFVIVDKSDTTMAASGTTKRIQSQYVTIADASTTVKGKVELATDAEAATSTDTVRALTPSNGQSIVAGATVAAAGKTTPIDADSIPLVDSAASNVLKKLTWANVKATLLTWLRLSTTIIPVNAPQGFLINGKIVPSVASNNLTVALKTLAGADPSATDPVYCRIGDTVRTITAALTYTSNAGSNYLNAGSAELATKEIDYFVYLNYRASNATMYIGFSRRPDLAIGAGVGSWSAEGGFNAVSNAAAGDELELIGRFAATLSAGAGYTWSVPTYTAINLIQRPIYETRILTAATVHTGFSVAPTATHLYKIVGRKVIISRSSSAVGTSNTTGFTFTLPFSANVTDGILSGHQGMCFVQNNTANNATPGQLRFNNGSNIVTAHLTFHGVAWTASGSKDLWFGDISYEI